MGIKKIIVFLSESYNEIRNKVSWPNIDTTKNTTFVVVFFIFIACCIIFALDFSFKNIVEYLYKHL